MPPEFFEVLVLVGQRIQKVLKGRGGACAGMVHVFHHARHEVRTRKRVDTTFNRV
jgi:hypothetical protein